MYINPGLYKEELALRDGTTNPWQKVNNEFAQHSRTAKLYGKPELSPEMQQALDSYKQTMESKDTTKVDIGAINVSDINEEEVLG